MCFQGHHYNFVANKDGVYAAIEQYLGFQTGRLSQVEEFKLIVEFEIRWLREKCQKYSPEFIDGLVQARIASCRESSVLKCGTPGCHYPKTSFRAKFCPKCLPRTTTIGAPTRISTGMTDAPRLCEECKMGVILPGEIYCLGCLGKE